MVKKKKRGGNWKSKVSFSLTAVNQRETHPRENDVPFRRASKGYGNLDSRRNRSRPFDISPVSSPSDKIGHGISRGDVSSTVTGKTSSLLKNFLSSFLSSFLSLSLSFSPFVSPLVQFREGRDERVTAEEEFPWPRYRV